MKVHVHIEEVLLENEEGRDVDGVRGFCSRCGHEEEACGTTVSSVRRCLKLLRENCPWGEENRYDCEEVGKG